MRQLQPRVVRERKKKLLQWVIHRYVKTSAPIASRSVAEDSGLNLSSASIRNVLSELEAEGYLRQPHTSAGRVPTDKGYRFYVDYLIDVQRLAAEEKESIERRYDQRLSELDRLLSETSKLLSHVSRSAGLVLSPRVEGHVLKRLEIIPLKGPQILAVVVTRAGLIRHWPITLSTAPTAAQINRLNRFLNENIQTRNIHELRQAVQQRIEAAEREIQELGRLADRLLEQIGSFDAPGELYMDGTARVLAHPEDLGDMREIQSLLTMIESKKALADLLRQELEQEAEEPQAPAAGSQHLVHVRIGGENRQPALKNLSLVTTTYRIGDRMVGVLGILGSKRMEYSRMMGLVDHVSSLVSRTLQEWTKE